MTPARSPPPVGDCPTIRRKPSACATPPCNSSASASPSTTSAPPSPRFSASQDLDELAAHHVGMAVTHETLTHGRGGRHRLVRVGRYPSEEVHGMVVPRLRPQVARSKFKPVVTGIIGRRHQVVVDEHRVVAAEIIEVTAPPRDHHRVPVHEGI